MMSWPTKKLRDLAEINRGSSPRPIHDTRFFDGGVIPWVKIADATKSGKFLLITKQHVNEHGASFSRRLPPGTILVAASGTLGYTQILGVEACAHDGWLILQNLRNLDRDFAYYALITLQRHFYNSAYGAAIQNINTEILRETEIPYPPVAIQVQIGQVLSAYDELIENNQRQIQILEEMARSLYREWFVHFRFPGHENLPRVSPLSKIPQAWEVCPLESLLSFQIGGGWGKEAADDQYVQPAWVIRGTDIPNARNLITDSVPHRYHTSSNLRSRKLEAGDIVFEVSGGSKGQPVGRSLFVTSELLSAFQGEDVICASFCKRIKPNATKYRSELLYLSFLEGYESGEIEQYQVQSTGISNFKWTEYIANTQRIVPPEALQESFGAMVKPLLEHVATLGFQSVNLRQTRDLLLPRLLSGQTKLETN